MSERNVSSIDLSGVNMRSNEALALVTVKMEMGSQFIKAFNIIAPRVASQIGRRATPEVIMSVMKRESGGFLDYDKFHDYCGLTLEGGDGDVGVKWSMSM